MRRTARNRSEEKQNQVLRTWKLRWYPSLQQKKIIKRWIGTCRWAYNQCVYYYRSNFNNFPSRQSHSSKKARTSARLKLLRNYLKSEYNQQNNSWYFDVPESITDASINEFVDALNSAEAVNEKLSDAGEPEIEYSVSFRRRRDFNCNIKVTERAFNGAQDSRKYKAKSRRDVRVLLKQDHYIDAFIDRLMQKSSGPRLTEKQAYLSNIKNTFEISMTRLGHYYYHLPQEPRGGVISEDEFNQRNNVHRVVAMDPGVRTFQTLYDSDGVVYHWGDGDMRRIFAVSLGLDKLQSKIDKIQKKKGKKYKRQRKNMKRAYYKQIDRVRNKIDDVHRKLVCWLVNNYKVILIPKFDTSRMIRKADRKLHCKTVRGMCSWAHYRFRQLLLVKTKVIQGCKVIVCDEAYTSRTCGMCGFINPKFSGKTFKCKSNSSCNYQVDRDVNGARNILLRYLTRNNIS